MDNFKCFTECFTDGSEISVYMWYFKGNIYTIYRRILPILYLKKSAVFIRHLLMNRKYTIILYYYCMFLTGATVLLHLVLEISVTTISCVTTLSVQFIRHLLIFDAFMYGKEWIIV